MRICEKCGKHMTSGYVLYDGALYYCSEECLFSEIPEEEYIRLYEDDAAYWTEWEDVQA